MTRQDCVRCRLLGSRCPDCRGRGALETLPDSVTLRELLRAAPLDAGEPAVADGGQASLEVFE